MHPSTLLVHLFLTVGLFDSSFLCQKMLDYLKEKRDAGFFKSLSGLMQSCRYSHIVYTSKKKNFCTDISCLVFDFLSFSPSASWTWMHSRGRTKQKVLAWWQRKVQVSEEMVFFFYITPFPTLMPHIFALSFLLEFSRSLLSVMKDPSPELMLNHDNFITLVSSQSNW